MKKNLLICSMFLLLTGCASPNVQLNPKFWHHKEHVKVANDKINRHYPILYKLGAQGFLDIAINDLVTNKFEHYLEDYKSDNLRTINHEFIERLQHQNMNASFYPREIDVRDLPFGHQDLHKFARRDYRSYAAQLGKNKLLIISVKAIGAVRHYYGFLPLGSPKAICTLEGQLINTKNNKILWRYTSKVVIPVDGKWDQPPHYPNFTRSLKEAIAISKSQLLDNFFSGTSG